MALIFGLLIFNPVFTGKVILSVDELYASGDFLFGNLKLNLEPREFIPASTNVLINSNEQESVFVLKDLINEQPKQGEFSIAGADISGFGEGYGVKEEYPEVSFTINFFKSKEKDKFDQKGLEENQTNETEIAEIPSVEITEENTELIEEVIEEPLLEIPAESPRDDTAVPSVEEQDADFPKKTPPGAEKKDENKPVEIPSEKPANKESVETLITGNAIGSFFSVFYLAMAGKVSLDDVETIEGSVSKNKPFIYKLKEDQTVQIIESSQEISFEIIGNEAIITTNYAKNESEYLINFSELGVSAGNDIEIKLEYGGIEFYSITKNLNFENLNESNQIIQEINFTTDNSTVQYGAVLGEPVKWKKTIKVSEQDTIVELPAQAENISVYKIENPQSIGQNLTLDNLATGNLILEYKSPKNNFFSNFVSFFTGRAIEITEKTEKIEINISENYSRPRTAYNETNLLPTTKSLGTEYEIEYVTPGPVAFEENTSYGKEVIISSEVHYENVLAYTELPKESNLREIKLYQITDGSYPEGHKKIPVDFIAYNVNNEVVEESNDLDDDVLDEIEKIVNQGNETSFGENKSLIYGEESNKELDYSVKKIRAKDENLVSHIEWIVPSLSNQTYELILITKAQHLDSNKNFISDIYEEVKALDGNWSEQINDSEYVRVTFEKNLTNQNDITIYAKPGCNGSILINKIEVPCDIYEKKMRIDAIRRMMK